MREISCFRPYGRRRKKLNIFPVPRILPGKANSIILLGFKYTINPQNLIKFLGAIFEQIEIQNFLCELPLILRLGQTQNYRLEIFARGPIYVEFECD